MKTQTFRSTLCALLFCLISVTGYADEGNFLARLDRDIFDAIYDEPPQSEPLGTIMEVGTYFGDGRTMLGVSLLLMAYGGDENRETGRLMTSTFISTGVIVWGMKEIIGRKRPLDDVVGNPAFPSGHTAYAFAGATLLGARYPKLRIPLYIGAGIGRGHPDLSWQALRLRCNRRRSGRHDNRGTRFAPSWDVVELAVLIWVAGAQWICQSTASGD